MLKQLIRSSAAYTLLLHLVSTPGIAQQLFSLHDLALYESGDALLGPEEKEALRDVRELAVRIDDLPEHVREEWRKLL